MTPATRRTSAALAGLAALVLALAACSGSDVAPTRPGDRITGELTVYAAASLAGAFDTIAENLERAHPGLDILPIVYDGSSTLATQVLEGAPADVFASADERTMALVAEAGLTAAEPRLFAANTLVIVVPEGNPAGIRTLADLADAERTVVLCAPQVPCGAASRQLLAAAGVGVTAASLEQNVTSVLTKVAAGEADAGLVYRTDAAARAGVEAISPRGSAEVVNRYPITVLERSGNPRAAAAFVDYVTGAAGRAVLADRGFEAPQ